MKQMKYKIYYIKIFNLLEWIEIQSVIKAHYKCPNT